MLRAAALVAAGGGLLPLEAVVLQVVDHLQQREAEDRLDEEPGRDLPAEHGDQSAEEHDGHEPRVEVVVADRPRALAQATEPLGLEVPGRPCGSHDAARQERPERLAEARAGRVLGGGDAGVVPTVVLDEEVSVPGGGQGDLGQPLLAPGDLVAELVRGVDPDPARDGHRPGHTDRGGDPEPAVVTEPRQVLGGPQVAGDDEGRVLEGDVQVGAPAVEGVRLEPVHHLVRRVLAVGSDRQVAEGDGDVDQDGEQEPRGGGGPAQTQPVEPDDERHREEQPHRRDQAEQPQVPLGVGPRVRLDRGVGGVTHRGGVLGGGVPGGGVRRGVPVGTLVCAPGADVLGAGHRQRPPKITVSVAHATVCHQD